MRMEESSFFGEVEGQKKTIHEINDKQMMLHLDPALKRLYKME